MKYICLIILSFILLSCGAEVYEVAYSEPYNKWVVTYKHIEWRHAYFYTQEGANRFAAIKDSTWADQPGIDE